MHQTLASLFGFSGFRPHQEAVIRAILDGRDTFTLMPTGGGKSLCYQLPARMLDGVCLVVSPLISLMKDQVDAARAVGLKAASLNSATPAQERAQTWAALRDGSLELLYVSPERLRVPGFMESLREARLAFFAIDEAHCISEWGHDFRPDYLALSDLRSSFPDVPIAAFTATATDRVAHDIVERLGLREPFRTRASFNRENLEYHVTPKEDVERQILHFVRGHADQSGIIYRTSRKAVEHTAALLARQGVQALPYHAGMADEDRIRTQDAFARDECPVIVATVAFGMGIDKSNVRYVLHGDLPKNMEGYYQETGRAGRDGAPAVCVLFYGRQDMARLLAFAEGMDDEQARAVAKHQLYAMLDFTQKDGCRRKALLAYFGEVLAEDNCGACDVCTGAVRREDATVSAQKLLSAMVRTGCRFGAGHVISVVLGKNLARLRSLGHDALPTYGVGKDRPEVYWRRVMDALYAQGLAAVRDPSFPVPVVTEAGWEVLRGERPCSIVVVAENQAARKPRSTDDYDAPSGLFADLREERRRLAQVHGVPPYVIFSDKTLLDMCRLLPDSPETMLRVSGVGKHKQESYGEHFLVILRAWRDEHPEDAARADTLAEDAPAPRSRREKDTAGTAGKPEKTPSWQETARLLENGLSLEAVAEARNLKLSTIYAHMNAMADEGVRLENRGYLSPEKLAYIRSLFRECGGWNLTPVVERSRTGEYGLISYDEAHVARVLLRQDMPDLAADTDRT